MNNKLTKILLATSAVVSFGAVQAKAADVVVVAEPEPVEYVRICDAYGAGYFYIPGTETCLKVGGYVRGDLGFGDLRGRTNDRGEDSYSALARVALQFSTATSTDLGQLSTFVELRSDFQDGGNEATGELRFGYIQLGGLRVGIDESAFNQFAGYYGSFVNDDTIRAGSYRTNLIQYTWANDNGFSALVSFEQGNLEDSVGVNANGDWVSNTINDYVPHVVVGAKVAQGWGSLVGVVGYDSNSEEVTGKVRLDININDAITVWGMAAYSTAEKFEADYFKTFNGDFAGWVGASVAFTDAATGNLQGAFAEDEFYIAANVAFELAPGLTLTPEVNYLSTDFDGVSEDAFGGVIRLQRSF